MNALAYEALKHIAAQCAEPGDTLRIIVGTARDGSDGAIVVRRPDGTFRCIVDMAGIHTPDRAIPTLPEIRDGQAS